MTTNADNPGRDLEQDAAAAQADIALYQNPETIFRLLRDARRIAIVGASANKLRASNNIAAYLRRQGYEVIPVNPREEEVLGMRCYSALAEVAPPIDIVNVFRKPAAAPAIVEEAAARGAKALWLQVGVIHLAAASRAAALGMAVVMDRCIKVEHARRIGRTHRHAGLAAAVDGAGGRG